MTDADRIARNRYFIMTGVNLGAVAGAVLGLLIAGRSQDNVTSILGGALILAYARLCRIGLWPARSSDDLIVKMEVERLVSERAADPDAMRALVEIALGVGRRIARQGPPFVTVLSGVEL